MLIRTHFLLTFTKVKIQALSLKYQFLLFDFFQNCTLIIFKIERQVLQHKIFTFVHFMVTEIQIIKKKKTINDLSCWYGTKHSCGLIVGKTGKRTHQSVLVTTYHPYVLMLHGISERRVSTAEPAGQLKVLQSDTNKNLHLI